MPLAGVLLLLSIAGCRTWGTIKDYSWKVKAPARLARDAYKSDLAFTVETRDAQGQPVQGISYWWRIDWAGVIGVHHKGRSFEEQSIRVKGAKGEAFINIFAYDDAGKETSVIREKVQIE
jgi:hypothetical protein